MPVAGALVSGVVGESIVEPSRGRAEVTSERALA